jgi:hypothetical protein
MRVRRAALTVLAAAAAMALHADAAKTTFDPRAVAGVYTYDFVNETGMGDQYSSTNVLEILRRSRTQAFVHVYLEFPNGHACEAGGLADIRGRSLVYDSHKPQDGATCRLILNVTPHQIVVDDPGNACREQLCSARGGFAGAHFDLAWRRPIRDVPQVMQSDALKGALAEYEAAHPAR